MMDGQAGRLVLPIASICCRLLLLDGWRWFAALPLSSGFPVLGCARGFSAPARCCVRWALLISTTLFTSGVAAQVYNSIYILFVS